MMDKKQALNERLAGELPAINAALFAALDGVPAPARPVAEHILKAGGKRLRPFLCVIMARLFGFRGDAVYPLAASMEMLHAATLLHDDVLDNAATRRGSPAAHTIYPVAAVILGGDALLARGNAIVAEWGEPALCACFSRATSETAAGEIMEIDSLCRPELDQEAYEAIALGKTGCLIGAACRMGALCAGAGEAGAALAARYGEKLGIAFQMVDDALDFAPESQTGKPCGGDLREGKMTPPLRLFRAALAGGERAEFDRKFAGRLFSEDEVADISGRIRSLGLDMKTRELANARLAEALACLDGLPGGERACLEGAAAYVRDRLR